MKTAFVVDGSNYLWRAHYATKEETTPEGIPVNAVRGFFTILAADMAKFSPAYAAVSFDVGGKCWRHAVYPEYKGNRNHDENVLRVLGIQRKLICQGLKSLGIKVVAKHGKEADDVIGTLTRLFHESKVKVLISSTDKDYHQLLSMPNVRMVEPKTRRVLGPRHTYDKFGVHPHQIVDYLSLLGDGVDNIPGLYKVGKVKASQLLEEYGTLRSIMKNAADLPQFIQDQLPDFDWRLNRKLITIKTDEPIRFNLGNYKVRPNFDAAQEVFDRMFLGSVANRMRAVL